MKLGFKRTTSLLSFIFSIKDLADDCFTDDDYVVIAKGITAAFTSMPLQLHKQKIKFHFISIQLHT